MSKRQLRTFLYSAGDLTMLTVMHREKPLAKSESILVTGYLNGYGALSANEIGSTRSLRSDSRDWCGNLCQLNFLATKNSRMRMCLHHRCWSNCLLQSVGLDVCRSGIDLMLYREFGITFLGPCCANAGHPLKRKPGGQWKTNAAWSFHLVCASSEIVLTDVILYLAFTLMKLFPLHTKKGN